MFAIIDIETTGLSPKTEKITEIAVFIFDGNKTIDQFTTLINPERNIPYQITRFTGITNQMVANAPKFYEIAKKIIEITENKTIVAHNASFDYGFIKEEFKRLGYNFKRKTLCTVKLSKKFLPNLSSYSLGNLCSKLGISISQRHRAAGDAAATVHLFKKLLDIDSNTKPLIAGMATNEQGLNAQLDINKIENLPEEAGVYYFYNKYKKLIYVGKSINIKNRVKQHLTNSTTPKAVEMKSKITDVDYEITGSEIVALLLESDEIKKNKPLYNRAQRRDSSVYGIYFYFNADDYLCFKIEKNTGSDIPLSTYSSQDAAKNHLEIFVENYNLCQKFTGLYPSEGECFHRSIKKCKGACTGEEKPEAYNQRAQKVVQRFEYEYKNFFIIDKGRNANEKAIVQIAGGKYIGFGYLDVNVVNQGVDFLRDSIKPYKNNRDTQLIILQFLKNNQYESLIVDDYRP